MEVIHSTRWRPGYGLTDGEVMERLWSYLRRFSSITKEMTPSHREDLLTEALLHYSHRKCADIGNIIVFVLIVTLKLCTLLYKYLNSGCISKMNVCCCNSLYDGCYWGIM